VDPAFRALIEQFVQAVQQQGVNELSRQIQEQFVPGLQQAAVASGQVSAEGAVSGPFLENLQRLAGQTQREAGQIVLGAQAAGLEQLARQRQLQDAQKLEVYRAQLQDAVNRGQLSLGEADLAFRVAAARTQAETQRADLTLRQQQLQMEQDLRRLELDLQSRVQLGQLSLAQAQLALETARAQAENALRQQALQLGVLDLLTGRQLDQARLASQIVQSEQGRRLQELALLAGLTGQDLATLLQGAQALKPLGQIQTTTASPSGLATGLDILGLGLRGLQTASLAGLLGGTAAGATAAGTTAFNPAWLFAFT